MDARAVVACLLAGSAQAFMHGGLVPLRSSVGASQALAISPMNARSSSLPLHCRSDASVTARLSVGRCGLRVDFVSRRVRANFA